MKVHFKSFLALILTFLSFSAFSQDSTATVFIMEIKSDIDARMNRYVDLALTEAADIKADLVIIEMDTYGGAVNDAKDIVERILDFETPVYVFIDKDAASAGALISIACDSIYMAPGSSIGAATVVIGDGTTAPDKYQSYMRSTMRSTAEKTGRDPKIAEAMVDEDLEVEGVSIKGDVITFTTSEAITHGFCEGQMNSVEEILDQVGVEDYTIVRYELDATEKIISIFINPFISGILILVIIGGIYFELQTPGVGFPILASLIAFIFYFVPYYLNGLAANWELVVFIVGIILLALEIFIIPGFGIAGVTGLIFMFGSLVLVMLNNDIFDFTFVNEEAIIKAVIATLLGMLGSVGLLVFGGFQFTKSKAFNSLSLDTVQNTKEGFTSKVHHNMVGKKGEAQTVLRPSGIVVIDGVTYDAHSRGNYIEPGVKIEVTNDEGSSLLVKPVE